MDNSFKNNSVTMIEMKVLTESQIKDFDTYIKDAIVQILDRDDDKFIAVEEINNRDILFLFIEKHKIDALIKLFNEFDLIDSYKEISEEVLKGTLDIEFISVIKSDEFKSMFDSFILKNLNSDMVLDKIIENGIESLSDNDKIILGQVK